MPVTPPAGWERTDLLGPSIRAEDEPSKSEHLCPEKETGRHSRDTRHLLERCPWLHSGPQGDGNTWAVTLAPRPWYFCRYQLYLLSPKLDTGVRSLTREEGPSHKPGLSAPNHQRSPPKTYNGYQSLPSARVIGHMVQVLLLAVSEAWFTTL